MGLEHLKIFACLHFTHHTNSFGFGAERLSLLHRRARVQHNPSLHNFVYFLLLIKRAVLFAYDNDFVLSSFSMF